MIIDNLLFVILRVLLFARKALEIEEPLETAFITCSRPLKTIIFKKNYLNCENGSCPIRFRDSTHFSNVKK
jgi:hypothetical protein